MSKPELTLALKRDLFLKCMELIDEKINFEVKAMEAAQVAANLETKSSAGDKYETGRAMMHIEKEKHGFQLEQNQVIRQRLSQIDVEKSQTRIQLGTLVCTNQGNYFTGVSLGELHIDGNSYFTLSMSSPLGKAFLNKEQGDKFEFRGKNITVESLL